MQTLQPSTTETAKKSENIFCKCALEVNFASITGSVFFIKKRVKSDVSYSAWTTQYQNNLNNHKERCFITQSTDICFQEIQEMHRAGKKSYFPLIADQCISGISIPGTESPILFFFMRTRDPATLLTLDLFLNPTISCHFSTIQRPMTPFPLDNKHPSYLANFI